MSEACYHLTHRSDGEAGVRIAVTGAFGFSGKYIAQRLLALRHEVITLTNSPQRANPFGGSIKPFPYNFSEPHALEKSLRGIDALINTYWVRFDNPRHFTFAQALANSKVLFDAAHLIRHPPACSAIRKGRYPDQQHCLGTTSFARLRHLRGRAISAAANLCRRPCRDGDRPHDWSDK